MTDTILTTRLTVRPMVADDVGAVLKFARGLPVHDLLFLRRDIRNEKVLRAWVEQIAQGTIHTLVAVSGESVVGCAALVRDALSWSPHVVEMRVLVAPTARGTGLGRRLVEEAFQHAVENEAEKIVVHVTPDQSAAITLFEELGFRAEAMLHDHVRDADGTTHDLAILSLNVARQGGQHRAFGMGAG